jgi:hypothetical protein
VLKIDTLIPATHNAVERQRRETLNGRFLDLAALLPNLSQIRRPSKSSIVNSSIAHIHASRRHRSVASRELRALKLEADNLRRELNEWRSRAGYPILEEPIRSEGFNNVISGEIEVLPAIQEDEEESGGYDGYDDFEDDLASAVQTGVENGDDLRMSATMHKNTSPKPFAVNLSPGVQADVIPRISHGPMIASSPSSVPFENPAMGSLYDSGFNNGALFMQEQSAWNTQLLMSNAQPQQILQPRAFLTPPASGLPTPTSANGSGPANPFSDQQFLMNLQRQQQHLLALHAQQQLGHLFTSPDVDDSSSVGSGRSGRSRSGSFGNGGGSGFCTPPSLDSPTGNYDMTSTANLASGANEFLVPRRTNGGGLRINTAWSDALMKQGSPIGVCGATGNGGFTM